MTHPIPVRAIEAVRVTRPDGEVVETVRTVEFAHPLPPGSPALATAGGGDRYDPERDSLLADSGLSYRHPAPAGAPALPPAPARGWLRWWRR